MAYTKENFEEWIILIPFKMEYFTDTFAGENNLKLDYSIESLDELEKWILSNYKKVNDLIEDRKTLDYMTVYIGETFRKYIGGKWYIDLKNKKNVFYSMPVLTSPEYKGITCQSPMIYATASIDRQKGDHISTILRNSMKRNSMK